MEKLQDKGTSLLSLSQTTMTAPVNTSWASALLYSIPESIADMIELDGRKLRVQLARPDAEVEEMNAQRREEREAKRAADKEAKRAAAADRAAAKKVDGEAATAVEGEAAPKPKKKKSAKVRTFASSISSARDWPVGRERRILKCQTLS